MKKIVVDIYGADAGSEVIIAGIADTIKKLDIMPVLVGDGSEINRVMTACGIEKNCYEVIHTTDVVTITIRPLAFSAAEMKAPLPLLIKS